MVSWWGMCWTWFPMKMMVGWRHNLLGCLFHWQLISFFICIVSLFRLRCLRLPSPPWCFEIVGLKWLRCRYDNHHSDSISDNSLKWQEFHLLVWCPRSDEKSRERRVKHKVVNLILIYFITNNAFYKIDSVTYKYEMIPSFKTLDIAWAGL